MDPEQQFIKWLVVGTAVSFAAYGIHLWWGSLGRQKVGAVPGRIDHLGRYAFRFDSVAHRVGPNYEADYGTVTVFDLATLQPVKRITVGDYPEGIAATADGRRIIVANWESNSISVIDAVELKVTGETKVGDGPRAFGAFLRR